MSWTIDALDRLAQQPCGYHVGDVSAAEPIALAAIALLGAGRLEAARSHLSWLANSQSSGGSVAPFADLNQPGWPTPWAIIAAAIASQYKPAQPDGRSELPAESHAFDMARAQAWLLSSEGVKSDQSPQFGHDPRLVGWPWVIGTHSWQEPTAAAVLALKAVGLENDRRTREGVKLLVDRLLTVGGCNYGNTVVLGQRLRPHIEPTGLTLLALAGETIDDLRVQRSLQYLASALSAETTPISLSYGLLGLTAHHRIPAAAAEWLENAYRRTIQRDAAPLSLALLTLAAQGARCPLISHTQAPARQAQGLQPRA